MTLKIEKQDYFLLCEQNGNFVELSRLLNGVQRLLPGTVTPTEAELEAAIETAENWLMPFLYGKKGNVLKVIDMTNQLSSSLFAFAEIEGDIWSLEQIEQTFLKLLDTITGRFALATFSKHRRFVADWLLVRELAHHGQFGIVILASNKP